MYSLTYKLIIIILMNNIYSSISDVLLTQWFSPLLLDSFTEQPVLLQSIFL